METERILGMKIHVSTFDELPFIEPDLRVRRRTKNQKMSIQFPIEMAEKKIALLSNEEVHFFRIDKE